MGIMGTTWGLMWGGDYGDHSHGGLGTTWGHCGDDGDNVGMMWTMWGQCGDDVGTTGTMWGQ